MDVRKSLPTFVEENLDYFREEREGCFTFLSKQHPETQQLLLNRTGGEVKKLCDGTNTLEDIHRNLTNRYPKVPSEVLREDINNIIRSFWKLGLIEWSGSNPFRKIHACHLGTDTEAYVATEEDVEMITDFLRIFCIPKKYGDIKTETPFYTNPALPLEGYSDIVMRQKIFFNTEGFFLFCVNKKVNGLISLSFPNFWLPDRTTMIGLMLCANTKEPTALLSELLDFSIEALQSIVPQKITCTKLKCLQLQDRGREANSEVRDFLKAKGFRQEAIFRDELGWGKDLLILSQWIL